MKERGAPTLRLLLGLTIAVLGILSVDGRATEPKTSPGEQGLSSARYFKMRPFTLPVMYKGEIEEHFTIVLALELAAEDARDEVRHRIPRIRNEFYRVLLGIVTFRRKGAPIPDIEIFRSKLMTVVQKTYGSKLVKDLLIQQAFKQAVR